LSWRIPLPATSIRIFDGHGIFCSFREFQNPERSDDQQSQGNQIENISLISSTEAEDNGANVAEFNSPYQAVVTSVKRARPYPTTSTPVASKQAISTPDISGSEEKSAKRARVYTEQSNDQLREPQNGSEDDDQVVLEHNIGTEGLEDVADTESTDVTELQTKLCKAIQRAVGDINELRLLDELHSRLKGKKALGRKLAPDEKLRHQQHVDTSGYGIEQAI